MQVLSRTVIAGIFATILFMVSATVTHAQTEGSTYYTNPETGYRVVIEDDAELLTSSERNDLAAVMEEITEYGNVAFKTIDENNYSTDFYADKFYHNTFDKDSGVLFLIDMDNRNIWIFSDGRIYKTVTKSYADTVTDNVYRYASRAEYYTCAEQVFEQITSLLRGQKIAQPMKYISNFLLAASLALLINFVVMNAMTKVKRPGKEELLKSVEKKFSSTKAEATFINKTKVYDPVSDSSSGGGGGGSSGGGGGSSGGGGGHSF